MNAPDAKELMTPSPAWCVPSDSLDTAARRMAEYDCGALPVVDDPVTRRPVGVITDRDIILRVVAHGKSTFDFTVGEVMSGDPITLRVDATFHECARAMMTHRVRRILVVDDRGKEIGVVTDGDLARACRQDPELEHEVAEMLEGVSDPTHFSGAPVIEITLTGQVTRRPPGE